MKGNDDIEAFEFAGVNMVYDVKRQGMFRPSRLARADLLTAGRATNDEVDRAIYERYEAELRKESVAAQFDREIVTEGSDVEVLGREFFESEIFDDIKDKVEEELQDPINYIPGWGVLLKALKTIFKSTTVADGEAVFENGNPYTDRAAPIGTPGNPRDDSDDFETQKGDAESDFPDDRAPGSPF